ncbi:vWA domain-containing protein [Cupriavidus necator]
MAYSAEINRTNPTAFFFLLDQSGSMADPFGGSESSRKKADGVADAVNKLLQNLAIKCAKESGIYDYFHIAIIGYGQSVTSAWAGALAGRELVPISDIANNPARIEQRTRKTDDGAGGLVDETIKFPVWFDPVGNGGTPMCQAFGYARSLVSRWTAEHPNGYPPIVINITDGESTDGDPSSAADAIRQLNTSDGDLLLFNLHISSTNSAPITFPDGEMALPDQYAKLLFNMSSTMPPGMRAAASADGFGVSEASRGYVFNADLVSLIRFLDIGTRPANLR